MILVVGATGLVGGETCARLAARGLDVRALVRPTSDQAKIEPLAAEGVELCLGDLKDEHSLAAACRGVRTVVSTASSTLARQPGDSIESVDRDGQLSLVRAAKAAGVERFVFVSFSLRPDLRYPIADAKRAVEEAISDMQHTILRAGYFMEVWLSPALGFDHRNGKARIYGSGSQKISWVSSRDVAEFCALAATAPTAANGTFGVAGPEALSPLEVVKIFEEESGSIFEVERVPEPVLRADFDAATDSMQKSFAGLMLQCAQGDVIDVKPALERFPVGLTTVREYARSVFGNNAASATH